jgi:hypothetical protein
MRRFNRAKHTQYGRVFVMDVEDERAELDERFY